jgi:hypothetical protein
MGVSQSIQIRLGSEELDEIDLPPSAAELLESMRAVGYSFESALADLIDNSLSARATRIEIHFTPYDHPYVAVLDNGIGMDEMEITCAMRHGSRDPRAIRDARDLGRFGLGLKTASLSQCRCLTVASLKGSTVSARRWDLDHIAARREWKLLQLRGSQIEKLPLFRELMGQGQGTLVVWQNFDRLTADGTPIDRALGSRVDLAREHLALVFHRFLAPPFGQDAVSISINRHPLRAIDPFLATHKATQALPLEEFEIEGDKVIVKPFILPHISKLRAPELELAGGEEGLRRNQGFYVYRNERLISWGSWFRLVRQAELTKLARVQVDISNRLDHLWQLDIKKSRAYPPESLREGLKQIIFRITEGSRRVYTYRGRKTPDGVTHAWERAVERDGISYRINREHPAISALERTHSEEQSALFEQTLRTLEQTIPFDAVYADMASELRPALPESNGDVYNNLLSLAENILRVLGSDTDEGQRFLAVLPKTEPFNIAPEAAKLIQLKLQK